MFDIVFFMPAIGLVFMLLGLGREGSLKPLFFLGFCVCIYPFLFHIGDIRAHFGSVFGFKETVFELGTVGTVLFVSIACFLNASPSPNVMKYEDFKSHALSVAFTLNFLVFGLFLDKDKP